MHTSNSTGDPRACAGVAPKEQPPRAGGSDTFFGKMSLRQFLGKAASKEPAVEASGSSRSRPSPIESTEEEPRLPHSSPKLSPKKIARNGDSRCNPIQAEHLPDQLQGATQKESVTLETCPTPEAMAAWLKERNFDTSDWGPHTKTKTVDKLWDEVRGQECGVESWIRADGVQVIVRVSHVLRAKVCSEESRMREVFLFNTWQQFGSGREEGVKRTRNGLLSEKLSTSEMPLDEHLHEVCVRAVTVEEMQRLEKANFSIRPGMKPPAFDPDYVCPLTVVNEVFIDHTTEMEFSKSYPRLLTLYHLYTVDIICTGLPTVDFNTLEYDHPHEDGHRKLKYVHAWVWLKWPEIRRFLFEGSEMKERKKQGSFQDADDLGHWLHQFDLDLDAWGTGGEKNKSVSDLWRELEDSEAHLEHWGRKDGAPLLMRVLHVMQLKVVSSDPSLKGKFLLKKWQMLPDEEQTPVYRLLSKKISTQYFPINDQEGGPFHKTAMAAVRKELKYLVNSFFQLRSECKPTLDEVESSDVKVNYVKFVDQHHDMEDSSSFKGVHTMYHLYTVEVECSELPLTNFASIEFRSLHSMRDSRNFTRALSAKTSNSSRSGPSGHEDAENFEAVCLNGWQWVSWEEALDLMHKNQKTMELDCQNLRSLHLAERAALESSSQKLAELRRQSDAIGALKNSSMDKEVLSLIDDIQSGVESLQEICQATIFKESLQDVCHPAIFKESQLPPSIISQLAKDTPVSGRSAAERPSTSLPQPEPVGEAVVGSSWTREPYLGEDSHTVTSHDPRSCTGRPTHGRGPLSCFWCL